MNMIRTAFVAKGLQTWKMVLWLSYTTTQTRIWQTLKTIELWCAGFSIEKTAKSCNVRSVPETLLEITRITTSAHVHTDEVKDYRRNLISLCFQVRNFVLPKRNVCVIFFHKNFMLARASLFLKRISRETEICSKFYFRVIHPTELWINRVNFSSIFDVCAFCSAHNFKTVSFS